jgi:hypothetical protein
MWLTRFELANQTTLVIWIYDATKPSDGNQLWLKNSLVASLFH